MYDVNIIPMNGSHQTCLVCSGVNSVNLPRDVHGRLFEGRWRARVVVIEREKSVQDSSSVGKDVLAERLIEWESLLASTEVCRGYECLSGDGSACVLGDNRGRCKCSQGEEGWDERDYHGGQEGGSGNGSSEVEVVFVPRRDEVTTRPPFDLSQDSRIYMWKPECAKSDKYKPSRVYNISDKTSRFKEMQSP